MSLATLERKILTELKAITGNSKLTRNSIMQWQTSKIEPQEGEKYVYLPTLQVHVCYKPKTKSAAQNSSQKQP